jgi:hypothetical protein
MSKTASVILWRTTVATLLLAAISACSSWDSTPRRDSATTGSPINNTNSQDTTNRDRGN